MIMVNLFDIHPHKAFLNTDVIISNNVDHPICITDTSINQKYLINSKDSCKIRLSAGEHIFNCCIDGKEQTDSVFIEDAIKFGGGSEKNMYVFEDSPWVIVVMNDRTYFYNRDTKEQFVECISPDEIKYVSPNILLLSNNYEGNYEYSLFSLIDKRPIKYFSNCLFYNSKIFIWDESSIDETCQSTIKTLKLYNFDKNNSAEASYNYTDFSVDELNNFVYVFCDKTITILDLSSVNTIIKKTVIKNQCFGCFLINPYYVCYDQNTSSTNFYIYSLLDDNYVRRIEGKPVVALIQNKTIINKDACKNDLLNIIKSEYTSINTNYLKITYSLSEYCFYLCGQRWYYIEKYTSFKNIGSFIIEDNITYLKAVNSELEIKLGNKYDIFMSGDRLIVNDGESIGYIESGKYKFSRLGHIKHCGKHIYCIFEDKEKKETVISNLFQGHFYSKGSGNYDLQWLDYNIYYDKDRKSILCGSWHIGKGDLFGLGSNTITTNTKQKYLYLYGVPVYSMNVVFPDHIKAISEKGNYVLSKEGTHIFLYKLSDSADGYVREEILAALYDSSEYGRVLLSDDGNYILYQNDKHMSLLNIKTNEKQDFDDLNYVSHINGYKPLVNLDATRRPRLINPLTKQEIDYRLIDQYHFVSPDGKYYASSDLNDHIKIHNNISKTDISDTEHKIIKHRFNYYDSLYINLSDDEILQRKKNREAFINENAEFFNFDDNQLAKVLEDNDFDYLFITKLCVLKIREIGSNNVIAELPRPSLSYLNYISFSDDSKYVALAGLGYKGVFCVYDIQKQETIYNICDDEVQRNVRAIWTSAFTKNGVIACYSSDPNTYIINAITEKNIYKLKNRSFLTFSSDGKYMALSDQGYIAWNGGENSNWGHQRTSDVFIYKIDDPQKELCSFSDIADSLSGVGVSKETVASVSFSSDNKKLMMVGSDKTVVIRNLYL